MDTRFSLEGMVSLIVSLMGIGAAFWIFKSEISKKLDSIIIGSNTESTEITRQIRVLTTLVDVKLTANSNLLSREQAKELSGIYIDYITAEVHRKVDQLILDLSDENKGFALFAKMREYSAEVKRSFYHIRGQTSDFYLINSMPFKQFIEEANDCFKSKIEESYKKFEQWLTDCIESKITVEEMRAETHKEIDITSNVVKDIVRMELFKIYRN
jgi:hypothetical protein